MVHRGLPDPPLAPSTTTHSPGRTVTRSRNAKAIVPWLSIELAATPASTPSGTGTRSSSGTTTWLANPPKPVSRAATRRPPGVVPAIALPGVNGSGGRS